MSVADGRERSEHWDEVYRTRRPDETSWFQHRPDRSLELLVGDGAVTPSSVVDVGAGESTLVDRLLEIGVHDVTLVDVSAEALQRSWDRVGRDPRVHLTVADVTAWVPTRRFAAWHDRATLHFLVDEADRDAYARAAAAAVEPGGRAVIGTFAVDGPTTCSGLPVRRHSTADVVDLLADAFELERSTDEVHVTPAGAEQHFLWVVVRRR